VTYTQIKLVGYVVSILGIVSLYFSVRQPGWYSRVLPWLGAILSVAVLAIGGVFAYVGTTEGPLLRQEDEPTKAELAAPVTSFEFQLVGQETTSKLDDYRGKVILLNLWASWCAPCLKELPALNRLQENYREKGLVVITLSPESEDHLEQFAQQHPFSTVNGFIPDKDALPDPFRRAFRTMPTSYVIDRAGFIKEFVIDSRTYEQWKDKVATVF
jgi:thiol-disulfide isomerase/thioredoxin